MALLLQLFSALIFFFDKASKKTISGWVMKQWHVNLGDALCYYNDNHKPSHKSYLSGEIEPKLYIPASYPFSAQ